jgi:hypothetical protein
MPSIEFFGYDQAELDELLPKLGDELSDLEFHHEIIYIIFESRVLDYRFKRQGFLRIYTRNEEKSSVLMERLQKYADVEYVKSAEVVFRKC